MKNAASEHGKLDSPVGGVFTGHRAASIVLLLLVSISFVFNVVLSHKLNEVKESKLNYPMGTPLPAGTVVPPIAGRRLGGNSETITYDDIDQPTVLYVFTPQCSWCSRNLDNFKALVDAKVHEYRFIGISLTTDGLAEYASAHDLRIPVYTIQSAATLKIYKLGLTPDTIVISHNGRVLQNWLGAYMGDQKHQVEAFFHVTLPGLLPVTSTTSKTTTPP